MPDRLQEIRARLDAATPGPWYADNNTDRLWVCQQGTGRPIADVADSDQSRDLIAHAPADIAWLLDEVERLSLFHAPGATALPHDDSVVQGVTKLECSGD